KFAGKPEQVVAYFTWIAEDVRRILAELGCQTLDEIIGRAELLERVDHPEVPRAQMLDLSVLLADPVGGHDAPRRRPVARAGRPGQRCGAFALPGMRLELEGEANDYVAKGLSGGEIVIRPFRESVLAGVADQQVLLGNTVLYGATGGKLFAAGRAGDRFAVRNSGAIAVIEGAGAHCCEYMTAGVVVVLGPVGRNFAAGMSNGVAYGVGGGEACAGRGTG